MDTWRLAANEGFEYKRFDDNLALEFIRKHYDARTQRAYLACAVPAMKADLFRVCALLIDPGIYVDADMRRSGGGRRNRWLDEESSPLLPLYQRLPRGLLLKRENTVANGFMIVKRPQDRLLQATLNAAIDNIEHRICNNVYTVTGPGIATRWLKELGSSHEYFRDFEFWRVDMLSPYMRMVGKLPYKTTADHWVNAQNARSIYATDVVE